MTLQNLGAMEKRPMATSKPSRFAACCVDGIIAWRDSAFGTGSRLESLESLAGRPGVVDDPPGGLPIQSS